MLRFLFRADSGAGIGHGHAVRSETLMSVVRDHGHEARLVFRPRPGQRELSSQFESPIALSVREADAHGGQRADAAATLARAAEFGFDPDIVVVDHYGLGPEWEHAVRSAGKYVVALDDTADRPHAADLVFELIPEDSVPRLPVTDGQTRRVRGLRYLPIGRDFEMLPPDWESPNRNILVSFGAWDPTGGTLIACEALERIRDASPDHAVTADVVIGRANESRDAVREFASRRTWVTAIDSVPSLAPLLRRSHYVICTAGNVLVEALAAGRRPVVIIVAQNQAELASHLAGAVGLRVFGAGEALDAVALAEAVIAQRDGISVSGRVPIDSLGAERLIARLLEEAGMSP
jgi:spore coat polysaccharide biosynthesis predicted glycosyltransferase SpsG